jgi:hypothetical protein
MLLLCAGATCAVLALVAFAAWQQHVWRITEKRYLEDIVHDRCEPEDDPTESTERSHS